MNTSSSKAKVCLISVLLNEVSLYIPNLLDPTGTCGRICFEVFSLVSWVTWACDSFVDVYFRSKK